VETGKILVVEDEGIVALQIAREVERLGYAVAGICDSGEKALESVESLRPDLVLMDIQLSGVMDGVEASRILSDRYDVPVVFLTAHSEEGTIDRAGATDPYGFIVKPFDAKDLQVGIKLALYKHKVDREKRQLTEELQKALEKVKLLSGYLPICVSCKKIRDDRGYWEAIEHYISQHSEAEFTHGICPNCLEKLYPEYAPARDR
jgi:CheY-like chemotaxis protein